ncbi:MAG: family 65 glycosyl hydrolase, partial [Acetanaerobacterium sp.]
MAKIADRYYKQNPWCIVEQGFSPDYTMVSESIFSLGNEHMGVRGYFDEGYGGKSLIGSYISGVYEEQPAMQSSYRGMVDTTYFIANTVDWLYTRITLDGERLDLAHSRFSDFTRWLDLRTGVLTRQFVWHTQSDKRLRLCFERFVSMDSPLFGGQRITVTPLDFDGVLEMICGLDFSKDHIAAGENLWDVTNSSVNEAGLCTMLARTHRSHKQVFAACRLSGDFTGCTPCAACEKRAVASLTVALKRGEDSTVTRVYESVVVKQSNVEEECSRAQSALVHADYDSL